MGVQEGYGQGDGAQRMGIARDKAGTSTVTLGQGQCGLPYSLTIARYPAVVSGGMLGAGDGGDSSNRPVISTSARLQAVITY